MKHYLYIFIGTSLVLTIIVGVIVLSHVKKTSIQKAYAGAPTTSPPRWIQAIGGDVYSAGSITVNKPPGW